MLGWSPESPFRPYEPRWNRALHGGRWLDGWWVSSGTAPPPLYRRDEWENETHTSGTCFPKGLCLILRPPHVKGDKNDVTRLIKHLLSSLWGWGYFLAVDLKTIILPALSTVAASWPFFLATTYFPLAARTHTWPSRHSSSNKPLFDLQQIKISLKMRVEVGEQLGFRCCSIQSARVCVCVSGYLVEAVHCSPPLAVRVQYFPAAVLKAHFLSSRLISIWKTSWSPSSSWLADRSMPGEG